MKIIYKERCPICHSYLAEDTAFTSIRYLCPKKHYTYTEKDFGIFKRSVDFDILKFTITYKVEEDIFSIKTRDTIEFIIDLPKLDFKWKELDKLNEKIKLLIMFS